ncbi:MAG: hypothetical protein O7D30_13130, partial [Rickettsia endosymbiont of Ixodes persulcatus]|nr:hypothetical protein [Rickettsia endosymbiont of Ixodes persulcatus]
YHNHNINQLLEDEHINIGSKRYSCPLKYIKNEMKNNVPGFIDEKYIDEGIQKGMVQGMQIGKALACHVRHDALASQAP